ncbi:hypothetical protein D8674_029480 [Pyrus ussuriensis x Pyrus communis]|uniref:C2H2-type domain-containing protein n=1 Tax=Pyrus ussuriensis x Pyrus communis TaxID=2448454 RepID=A0A5N5I273_9ROSA|nr:hypothetical protein D8674_029480 [Pyrus ussuriensis x Pyrus communis]
MKKTNLFVSILLFLSFSILQVSSLTQTNQDFEKSESSRTLEQGQEHAHEVHCSRERSRAAWQIIEKYLMPFVEHEHYEIPSNCRLHPDNDLFRDQEEHKIHLDINEWQCGYCKKSFRAEMFLDQHFDNRHYNLLNVSGSKCLADLCGSLHCNAVMNTKSSKTKCNPAAVARNHHLCEGLANSCFPINQSPSARRLNETYKCILPGYLHTDFDAAPYFLSDSAPKRDEERNPRA